MNGVRLVSAIASKWPTTLSCSPACLRASRSSFTRRLDNAGVPTALVDTLDIPSFDMTLWR
ncbi:hypothetical protein EMIT0196MI5_70031 [Pseudomonas sp. IT-196MI5]